eukprot:1755307-Karenia_brevis.AAC.1
MEKQRAFKEEGMEQSQIKESMRIPAIWGFNYMIMALMEKMENPHKQEVQEVIQQMQEVEKSGKSKCGNGSIRRSSIQ